jgi:hypothetical protein
LGVELSLVDTVSPIEVQEEIDRGRERLSAFREFRLKSLRAYVGPHYDRGGSDVGAEPLNMTYNAIRVLVPTLVLNFPKHVVATPYIQAKQYADLLSLALEQHDRKINIRDTYRRVIVDGLFALGILKTGLAQSDSVYALDDEQWISQGEIYTEAVDFDDWIVDPKSREHMFRDARFMGHKLTVPRRMLLDSGLYNNDLIERLPTGGSVSEGRNKAQTLSQKHIQREELSDLEDDVEIYEVWVPSANAVVTVPASKDTKFDDYLRVADYYGVKEGPYTLLSFSPAVPGNPLPVALTSVWYDLHILGNLMAKKIIDQAQRQKSLLAYKRAAVDDAEEIKNAGDGEGIAVDDPSAVTALNLGGQLNSNETHLAQLMGWFNMMAANPEQVGGQNIDAKSATAASILQNNANVGLSDMKDMVYVMAAEEARKRAWYLHTDPMIKLPMTKRQMMPPQVVVGPMGPIMAPPMMQDVQVILTPEARSGDFMDFNFSIQPESMGRLDSKVRLQQEISFCTQILPAVMAAAQESMALGIPLNAVGLLIQMGRDMGLETIDQIIFDPAFQQQMLMQQMMGPSIQGSKGEMAPANSGLTPSILQNGQPGQVGASPFQGPGTAMQKNAQSGSNGAQRMLRTEIGRSLSAPKPGPVSSLV